MRFLEPGAALSVRRANALAPGAVHVWPFVLAGPEAVRTQCAQLLSEGELARANRFVFERDRLRHIFAHGVMRHLLGLYCGRPPASLELETGPVGKPSLRPMPGAPSVSFNLSHAGERGLLAIADGREIGADLEEARPDIEALSIARNYFYGAEFEAIQAAHGDARIAAFFRYWTAKEAVIKGDGSGLRIPLDKFEVRFLEGNTVAEVASLDLAQLQPDWFVRTLPATDGWFAALAARTRDWHFEIASV